MSNPDHYQRLGIPRFAPPAMVRQGFVQLMKAHHYGGSLPLSEDAVREVGLAYWELRHPERRAAYDAALRTRTRPSVSRPSRPAAKPVKSGKPAAKVRRASRSTPPRGTRAVFVTSLVVLATGLSWAVTHRAAPTVVAAPPLSLPATMSPVAIDTTALARATKDFDIMTTRGGLLPVTRYIAQCFANLAPKPPFRLFDYCVALEALAAREPGARRQIRYTKPARQTRAIDALGRPEQAQARWAAIEAAVTRLDQHPSARWQLQPAAADARSRR